MINEMTNKVGDAVKSYYEYRNQLLNANVKACRAHYDYMEYKHLSYALNNEVCDNDRSAMELHAQASQYEEVIDYLCNEQFQMQQNFDQVAHYFNKFTMKTENSKMSNSHIHELSKSLEEVHHHWSFNNHAFTAEDLFDH